jgi:seryl-tRNA synthetase
MKITGVLAGLLVLVLIGLTVYQNHLIKRVNREAAEEKASVAGTAEGGGTVADTEAFKQQQIEFQKQILSDPAVRESVQSGLEAQYKSLFEKLALPPEKQEELKALLTGSVMDYLELNPEILAAVTDEEKQVLQQRYDYLRKETQFRTEALLGHDAYLTYLAYEERTFPRTVVSGFSG